LRSLERERMKKQGKNLKNNVGSNSENKAVFLDQLEQQNVQQRYHSELEKYQEQIIRREELDSQDGQAA
jgi:hypothetical protein